MSSDEECDLNKCLNCQKVIDEKPWLIVKVEEKTIYGCSYGCSKHFRRLIGINYWSNVVNKEDFNEPRPIYGYTSRTSNKDITTGFGMDEIKHEIQLEDKRIKMLEDEYEEGYSSDDLISEDNYSY